MFNELGLLLGLSKTTDGGIWTNPVLLDAYYKTPHDEIMETAAEPIRVDARAFGRIKYENCHFNR